MSNRLLEMGITAFQRNSAAEGARLMRIALKQPTLPPELRAVAYLWLAETCGDAVQRRQYLTQAASADPNNTEARTRLAQAMMPTPPPAAAPPPVPAPTVVPPPSTEPMAAAAVTPTAPGQVNVAQYVARIIGGPDGAGTGVFIADNLIATTRRIAGNLERVTVEVYGAPQMPALVVRSFPELDLAFLQVDYRVAGMLPITPQPRVPDDAPLIAVAFSGEMIEGRQRPTRRAMAAHWIPTTILRLPDAGGDPIFDEQLYLVGILTDNTSRTSDHRFGVHITAIRRALDLWLAEARERRVYCPTCGASSRAGGAGLHYCETCGGVLPAARARVRIPLTGTEAYYPRGTYCDRCKGEVGFYAGRCLRCGGMKA